MGVFQQPAYFPASPGRSKGVGCKAPEIPSRESYCFVRRAVRDKGNAADDLFSAARLLLVSYGCSKMSRCEAPEVPSCESYCFVRRAARDEGNEADGRFSTAGYRRMRFAPHDNPPPNDTVTTRSPGPTAPAARASSRAIRTDAPAVLPYS